jgi:hypothetical protein
MEEQQGLSASGTGGMDEAKMKELLMQVIQMLQQGHTPDELAQMGVPKEIIEYAVQMIQQGQGQEVQGQGQTTDVAADTAQQQQVQPLSLSKMGA